MLQSKKSGNPGLNVFHYFKDFFQKNVTFLAGLHHSQGDRLGRIFAQRAIGQNH
jgi:hypothetical protein